MGIGTYRVAFSPIPSFLDGILSEIIFFAHLSDMDNPNLDFLKGGQSVALLIRQLRDYFKDSYAHCKVERGQLLNRLETADSDEESSTVSLQLKKVDQALYIFGVLSDTLSIANRVVHSSTVMNELGKDDIMYQLRDTKQD